MSNFCRPNNLDRRVRRSNLLKARLAEKAKRYEDMVTAMNAVFKHSGPEELTTEEINLLYEGYKNKINSRRESWKIMCGLRTQILGEGDADHIAVVTSFKHDLEYEMRDICSSFFQVLRNKTLPGSGKDRILLYRSMGDFHRYLAAFDTDHKEKAETFYMCAQGVAVKEFLPSDPVRLHLANVLFTFYFTTMNKPTKALMLAQRALDYAESDLQHIALPMGRFPDWGTQTNRQTEEMMAQLREHIAEAKRSIGELKHHRNIYLNR